MHHHYSTFQSYENNNGREKSVSGENRDGHVTIQGNVNGQPFYYDNAQPRVEPSLTLSRTTPSFRENSVYVSPYSNFYGGTGRRIRRRRPYSKKKQQKRKGRKSNKNGKRKSKKSRK
jgi:hypothetical protein